jgi:hypothetical protein
MAKSQNSVLEDVMECSLIEATASVECGVSIFRVEEALFYPEDGGSTFLGKLSKYQTTWRHILEQSSLHRHVKSQSDSSVPIFFSMVL